MIHLLTLCCIPSHYTLQATTIFPIFCDHFQMSAFSRFSTWTAILRGKQLLPQLTEQVSDSKNIQNRETLHRLGKIKTENKAAEGNWLTYVHVKNVN